MTVVISMTIDIIFNEKEEGTKKKGGIFFVLSIFSRSIQIQDIPKQVIRKPLIIRSPINR